MHPMRREVLDEDFNNMNYLLEKFKNECIVKFSEETQGQLIGGMLNRTEKAVGYPKMPSAPPVPEFNRADEPVIKNSMTGQVLDPNPKTPLVESKLTNAPKVEAFDRATFTWVHCPDCGKTNIKKTKQDGTVYYACFDCGIFLNKSKENQPVIKEMKAKGA
jgi:predicted RNA-binding Zn-ribbon protein involved in translation (DUF1610 family)